MCQYATKRGGPRWARPPDSRQESRYRHLKDWTTLAENRWTHDGRKLTPHKDEHRAEILDEHQPHIRKPGLVIPTCVEILDDAPEYPEAGDDGGQAHRYPAYDLGFVELLHLRIPTDIRFPGPLASCGVPWARQVPWSHIDLKWQFPGCFHAQFHIVQTDVSSEDPPLIVQFLHLFI
jgi:hypothetical protein